MGIAFVADNQHIMTISDFVAVLYDQRDEVKAGLGSHSALFQFTKPLYTNYLAKNNKRKNANRVINKRLAFHFVPPAVLFSNQFLDDLDKIWELRHWIPDPTKPIFPPNIAKRL